MHLDTYCSLGCLHRGFDQLSRLSGGDSYGLA